MGRLSENSIVVLKNKSYAVTAAIDIPDEGAGRRDRRPGGAFGGWTLYAHEGRPAYCYNLFGLQRFKVYGEEPSPLASIRFAWSSPTTAAASARAGTATLYLDGEKVGEGRVEATVPMVFSADETTDIGSDTATPVTDDLVEGKTHFSGRVRWVQIDLGDDAEDADHLITPEERYRIAMARQ